MDDDIYPDDDHPVHMNKIDFEKIYRESPKREKYLIKINKFTGETKVINKPITFPYGESEYLMNKGSIHLLQSYGLELPSHYKDKSLKELEEALEKSQAISSKYKDKIRNVANYNYVEGKSIARPKNKNPRQEMILENIISWKFTITI